MNAVIRTGFEAINHYLNDTDKFWLVSNFWDPKEVDCEATQYDLRCEQKAVEKYEKLNQCQVKREGVISNKDQPWLCASVDGVVKDGFVIKLVEIIYPISCKNKTVTNFENNWEL